jgi:phosphoribosylamine--glycine ligase
MNVLVVGSGGREHALVKAIARSPLCDRVYALPGNPGMREAVCLPGDVMDTVALINASKANEIHFVVIGPDDPLAMGLVDALEEAGIACFGPTRQAAQIEASKVFAKRMMQQHNIPTAAFQVFDELTDALAFVSQRPCPLVVKADGLARGKGVIVAHSQKEAEQALRAIMQDRVFGTSGSQVVIEEMLTGPEVSVLALCDGTTVVPMVSAMDHKRAYNYDEEPNTGGMGVIAPNPYYTDDIAERCMQEIFLPTVQAMKDNGHPFKGCLFFGLMLAPDGPMVLEYNARFGDPEMQAALALLSSDLLSELLSVRRGTLKDTDISFIDGHACCVVMASWGYPEQVQTGFPITVDSDALSYVDFAGVKEKDGQWLTAGGRVLSVMRTGDILQQAIEAAYDTIAQIRFEGGFLCTDIGARALTGGQYG